MITFEISDKIFLSLEKYGDLLKSDPRTKFIIIGIASMIALLTPQLSSLQNKSNNH